MDDDYEARMRERAARRAAAKAAAGETSAPVESTPAAAAPPADDYEARMRERALKRENSKKEINEISREASPKKEEEEEAPKQKHEEEEPKKVEEEEEEEAPKQQEEEEPKKVEEPVEEEQPPKKEPTPPPKEEEEDSYKKPRSSTRSQAGRSSVASSTPSSTSSRSTPTPAATTSAPSSRFGSSSTSSSTSSSSTPATRSVGRDRPVSVASPPTEKKDFGRSNRFSVAPESTSTPPPQTSDEAPKRKAISLASKSQEAEDMVKRIVEGDEDVAWVLFNCDQNVQIHAQGVGEVEALKAKLDDTMVLYGYIRVPVGAEGRTKFVYIRWVGTKIKPIQRAKALDNEKVIKSFTRVYHIEVHTSERDDLTSSKVNDKLARAGGANYDKTQNTGGKVDSNASFSSYKERSRDFFYEKEREGNVKQVVFEKGPIGRTTPVNLAGRAMTVGAATANKNLVDLKTKKNQE